MKLDKIVFDCGIFLGSAEGSIKQGNRTEAKKYLRGAYHHIKKLGRASKNPENETLRYARRAYELRVEEYQEKFGEEFKD